MIDPKEVQQHELEGLCREQSEMNQQKLKFCARCHASIRSETVVYDSLRPIVHYQPPPRCNCCKSTNYEKDNVVESYLPSEKDGILCRCKDPECRKEFWNRPSWYKLQQQMAESQGNPWMPELIDKDPERLKRLENEAELISQ